jgi:hypothetical protein
MRGRLAAACAAVLVGMSPAGALPFASFAAAVSCQAGDAAVQRNAVAASSRSKPVAAAALRVKPASAVRRAVAAAELRIWRSPSGPAPSRAPPAA